MCQHQVVFIPSKIMCKLFFSSTANIFSLGEVSPKRKKEKIKNEFLGQKDFKDFSIING
jgi:hypothetical protein